MRALALTTLVCLSACAEFPEVAAAEARLVPGPAPLLLPSDDLAARIGAPPLSDDGSVLAARAAALKTRAGALRAAPAP